MTFSRNGNAAHKNDVSDALCRYCGDFSIALSGLDVSFALVTIRNQYYGHGCPGGVMSCESCIKRAWLEPRAVLDLTQVCQKKKISKAFWLVELHCCPDFRKITFHAKMLIAPYKAVL